MMGGCGYIALFAPGFTGVHVQAGLPPVPPAGVAAQKWAAFDAVRNAPVQDRAQLNRTLMRDLGAILAAVGYNFSLLLNWLRLLFAFFLATIAAALRAPYPAKAV